MKLFFEDYNYHLPIIQKSGLSQYFYISERSEEAKLISVGYFYAPEIQDVVFILPKIFLGRLSLQKDTNGNSVFEPGPDNTILWAVFGKYLPETIYDLNDSNNPLLEDSRLQTILQMTVWLYQSIVKYQRRNGKTDIISSQPNKIAKRIGRDDDATYLDVVLSMLRFHKEHQNLFTFISKINNSGNNKIHWGKTISRIQPLLQKGEPIYREFCNKNKTINYDEEIVVLFYSVLHYLKQSFRFASKPNINYSLITPHRIKTLIDSGKGTKYLRLIRRKYFSDELVALWNLIGDEEFDKYRRLPDGKIIDHLYVDKSLTSDGQIYFIGDSKYYKKEEDIEGTSVFKQYTYAKNIIQLNIDAILEHQQPKQVRYRDELSEGYDITPNFFIRGYVDPDKMNFTDPALKPMRSLFAPNRHYVNRPFDRDSLVLCGFNINFLYVLSHYVLESGSSPSRSMLKQHLREGIVNRLNSVYEFYKVFPSISIKDYIVSRRDLYRGQLFRPSDTSNYVLFGFDKSTPGALDKLSSDSNILSVERLILV